MKSFPLPARIKRLILTCTLPVFALSACKTVDVTLSAPSCFTEMVQASGLTDDTPHASLPVEASAGAWVAYGNQEGGQLDKANSAKRAVVGIGQTCDRWADEAKQRAERKPWWRRVF